jgi:hypothetical protein
MELSFQVYLEPNDVRCLGLKRAIHSGCCECDDAHPQRGA